MDYQLNRMFSELKNNCETYDQAVAFNDLLATFSDGDGDEDDAMYADDDDDVEAGDKSAAVADAADKAASVAAATGADEDEVKDVAKDAAADTAAAVASDAAATDGTLTASDIEYIYNATYCDAFVDMCNAMFSEVCYGNRNFSSVVENGYRMFADAKKEPSIPMRGGKADSVKTILSARRRDNRGIMSGTKAGIKAQLAGRWMKNNPWKTAGIAGAGAAALAAGGYALYRHNKAKKEAAARAALEDMD